ncbi:MAG: ATP-dependent DNA helicase RecG [Sulfurimonas sp.]|jgi:ATP-dependent DNA helicase RecG
MIIESKEDLLELQENHEIEFKKAQGRDGNGELPDDFFETYCAMANSYGGSVFLGIQEHKDKSLEVVGIKHTNKVKKKLFDSLNNKQKISLNILTDASVIELNLEEKTVIQIIIPRAKRQERPIYEGLNPLVGTYIRNFEGDYKCDEESVKRMLAEQKEDSRDSRLLEGYDFNDIQLESLIAYRNLFASTKPDHPFNTYDNVEFMRNIGGWKRDRQTDKEGLTLAGLVMFGKLYAIQEELNNYMIDYQERPEAKKESRWIDRLTIDGTWSGNIFDFYQKVIRKLYSDLKVPFVLDKDIRKDETPIHTALREALINTIVHADYTGRSSLLVVKRPDMFGFRNPGLMRISIDSAIRGGESDCRNRTIHQMFLLIGLGERAGSGLPKIFSGWSSQHWSKPLLHEKHEPEQTLLELRMINLFDDAVIETLKEMFGERFSELDEDKRVILVTTYLEKVINHNRANEIIDKHAHDVSQLLKQLVDDRFLDSNGQSRGKVYFLPNTHFDNPDEFSPLAPELSSRTPDISDGTPEVRKGTPEVSDEAPEVLSSLGQLDALNQELLRKLSEPVSQNKRVAPQITKETILNLCEDYYLTLPVLAQLLSRSSEFLRKEFLNPMVINEHSLQRAFPQIPNHPKQAYKKV